MIALLLLVVGAEPAPPPPAVAKAQHGGYRGIPWGTPCSDAVDRLTTLNVTFQSPLAKAIDYEFAFLRGLEAFAPACDSATSNEMIPGISATYGEFDGLDVTVICEDGLLSAVRLQGDGPEIEGTIKKSAGAPVLSRTIRPSVGGASVARYSKLSPAADSVRYLGELWHEGQDREFYSRTTQYEVLSAKFANRVATALAKCAADRASAQARSQQRSTKARESLMP